MSPLVFFALGCAAIIAAGATLLGIWEALDRLAIHLQERAGRRIGRRANDP